MTFTTMLRAMAGAGALAIAIVPLGAQAPNPGAAGAVANVDAIRHAIATAVVARVGTGADVDVQLASAIAPTWHGDLTSVAIDPAARLGAPVFATFLAGPSASLRVSATVRIVADYVRASHAIPAGQVIAAGDITPVRDVVPAMPLRHLPTAGEVIGAKSIRRMAAGDILQAGFVVIAPVVTIGEPVTAIARIGDLEVAARFIAADNGRIGDLIRIVNPDTKRSLRARVVKAGTVEVFNER
jgi:flagella basal body P-ring formation protein FlgA